MHRILVAILSLALCGSVTGVVVSWPKHVTAPPSTSVTLNEFQTMVAFQSKADDLEPESSLNQKSVARGQDAAPVAQIETATESLTSVAEAPGALYLPGARQDLRAYQFAALQSPALPEERWPMPGSVLSAAPEALVDASSAPIETSASRRDHEPSSRKAALGTAVNRQPGTWDLSAPDDQAARIPPADPSRPALEGYRIELLSIHYRKEEDSLRIGAQQIAKDLYTGGLRKIDLRTTSQKTPSPLIRYFWRTDAAAAAAIASYLNTNSTMWRIDDCTAFRHRPEKGTLQIWPATQPTMGSIAHARAPTCKSIAREQKLAGNSLATFMAHCKADTVELCNKLAAGQERSEKEKADFSRKCLSQGTG